MPTKRSFESLYSALEDTTRRLEQGNLPLEDSLKLYEQGTDLVEELRTILDEAELHVKTLRVRLQPDVVPPDVPADRDDVPSVALDDVEVFEFEDDLGDE